MNASQWEERELELGAALGTIGLGRVTEGGAVVDLRCGETLHAVWAIGGQDEPHTVAVALVDAEDRCVDCGSAVSGLRAIVVRECDTHERGLAYRTDDPVSAVALTNLLVQGVLDGDGCDWCGG